MSKIKLDLHDIFNKSEAIETELNRVIEEAMRKKIPLVEIIPGKGSGQLKKTCDTVFTEAGNKKSLSSIRERR